MLFFLLEKVKGFRVCVGIHAFIHGGSRSGNNNEIISKMTMMMKEMGQIA
jgi:hypothetical protein